MKNRRLKLKQIRKQYLEDVKYRQNLNPFCWNDANRIDFLTEIITKG